jgi:hypothetical protein
MKQSLRRRGHARRGGIGFLWVLAFLRFAFPSSATEPQNPAAAAADIAASEFLPGTFITSRTPPGMLEGVPSAIAPQPSGPDLEKSSAVTGELYSVIAPIFLGGGPDGGNTSFIRFFNAQGRSASFKINVVAYKTDSTTDSGASLLGSATLTVPNYASLQYSANDILSVIGWPQLSCPETCLEHGYQGAAFYLTSSDTYMAYQHVIYNSTSRFFENMTICGDKSFSDARVAGNNITLINIHTSKLADYPAYITFHNYATGNRKYAFLFYDARTGTTTDPVAVVVRDALANTSYTIPMSWFESQAKWTPTSSQLHVNLMVVEYDLNGSQAIGEIKATGGLLIYNTALRSYVNMSQTCQLLHRTANAP